MPRQETVQYRANLTAAEVDQVNEFINDLRNVGRVQIAKTDATAAIFLTALNNPKIAEQIKHYIKTEMNK